MSKKGSAPKAKKGADILATLQASEAANEKLKLHADEDQGESLTTLVQTILDEMQAEFKAVSDGMIQRFDKMEGRLSAMEKNIDKLMKIAGTDAETSSTAQGAE
eukprot:g44415.t1